MENNIQDEGELATSSPISSTQALQERGKEEEPTEMVEDHNSPNISNIVDKEVIDLEEKRRRECLGNMEKIEKEFADLKEKFFTEKIEALKKEYEMIKNGTHQGFIKKCKELEESREHKIWAAEKWREYQLENIENIFQAEKKQCEDEYKTDKKNLREKMMAITLEKRKKLMDEKNTMNLTDGTERVTRALRKRGISKDSKDQAAYKRRLNPPHINYILKDTEIHEDLSLIQKASNHPTYGKIDHIGKNPSDVYTDRGRLYYHNQIFEKGKEVEIEAKHENGKWIGVIVVVNPAEIHIKSPDGTKSRFSLSQLRNGRYTISIS